MSDHDELVARAKARAETAPIPDDWGFRVALEENESFLGSWRGETTDPDNDDRRIFLLSDEDGKPCFSRAYAALNREIDRVQPQPGYTVVIYRGADYEAAQGTGYSFGVEVERGEKPPAGGSAPEIPFMPSGGPGC